MRFHDLVTTSRRVASTSARLGKIELLASSLRALSVDEVEIGVAFLAGTLRQRRLGLGPAALQSAHTTAATEPTRELRDVATAFASHRRARRRSWAARRRSSGT
jgi:DNA ligase-1